MKDKVRAGTSGQQQSCYVCQKGHYLVSQPWEQGSLYINSLLYFTKHFHICGLFLLSHNAVNYYRKSKREELRNQQRRWFRK